MSTPNRACPQCGTQVEPGQGFCSNCGTKVEPASIPSQPGTPYAQPGDPYAYNRGSGPSQPGISNPDQPPLALIQYATPLSPYGNTSYGAPPPPNAGSAPPPPYGQGQGIYGQPYGQYGQQPTPVPTPGIIYPEAPKSRKGRNIALIVGGVILVLLLACGGSVLALRSVISQVGKNSTTPTVNNLAPTQAVVPTAAALFTDNFADNSKSWSTAGGTGYSRTVGNNELALKEANHKVLTDTIPTTVPTNFTITTTFTLLKGDQNDSAGLLFRTPSNDITQGYYAEIYGDDNYDIIKIYPDPANNTKNKLETLSGPSTSPAIHPKGQPNKMTVIMKGSSIVLYINDTFIASVTDNSNIFVSGDTTLFAQNGDSSNGVEASFQSIAVYPAPNVLPTE